MIQFMKSFLAQKANFPHIKNRKISIECQISIYLVDLVIENLIVEFNGRHHYFNFRREGGYQIKIDNLRKLGY